MKYIGLLSFSLLLGTSVFSGIQSSAAPLVQDDSRTAAPSTSKPVKVIHPTGSFDLAAAKTAIEPGSGTIRGAACVVKTVTGHEGMTRADNQKVVLYPASPYIEDMLNLIHKTKPGSADIEADPAITAVRLEGKTNENGQFQFSKMKPGKYFVVADVHSTIAGSRNVYTGSGYSADAFGGFTTDYYQKQNFTVNYEDILYQEVEVKGDEMVHVTLFKPGKWGFAGIALKPTCK